MFAWKMRAAEHSEPTEADGEGRSREGREKRSRENEWEEEGARDWQTFTVHLLGTFSICRMTLPIAISREVEHVSSCARSPHLARRAITTGTHPLPASPPPVLLQLIEISQQTCDSSFRVIGLSCIRLRSLTACRRHKEHRAMTKQSSSLQRRGHHKNHLTFSLGQIRKAETQDQPGAAADIL